MNVLLQKRLVVSGVIAGALTFILAFTGSVSAHVVVTPKQLLTAERATFAVSVPNEHDTPVVGVRLIIPEGLTSVRPYAKAGWEVTVKSTGEGEDVSATEITWASAGNNIPVSLKDDFLFGAKTPAEATDLVWKAYETYADGTVVGWDQEPSEGAGNKPYSVTKVAVESDDSAVSKNINTENAANRALYVGIAGVVLGLVGIALGTRKK